MKVVQDIEEFIQYTKDYQIGEPMWSVQVDLFDKDKVLGFTEYLVSIAEHSRVDALDCNGSFRKLPSDITPIKALEIMTEGNVLKSGIKIDHIPYFKYNERSSWVGGYIEGFTSFSHNPEYLIWTYIKMDHLEDILNKFKDNLIDYRC